MASSFDLDECGECVIAGELILVDDGKIDALPFNDKRDIGGDGCAGNVCRGKPNRSMSDGISVSNDSSNDVIRVCMCVCRSLCV